MALMRGFSGQPGVSRRGIANGLVSPKKIRPAIFWGGVRGLGGGRLTSHELRMRI